MAKVNGSANKYLRPNYFIAIEIANTEIIQKVADLQKEVLQPSLIVPSNGCQRDVRIFEDCMVPVTKLHFTVNIMHLNGHSDLETAQLILEEVGNLVQEEILSDPIDLTIEGLGNFGDTVIFGKVKDNASIDRLTKLHDLFQSKFHERLNLPLETRPYVPHLTIGKITKSSKCHETGLPFFPKSMWKPFQETHFGVQRVTGLQLLQMGTDDPCTGYYMGHGSYDFSERTNNKNDEC